MKDCNSELWECMVEKLFTEGSKLQREDRAKIWRTAFKVRGREWVHRYGQGRRSILCKGRGQGRRSSGGKGRGQDRETVYLRGLQLDSSHRGGVKRRWEGGGPGQTKPGWPFEGNWFYLKRNAKSLRCLKGVCVDLEKINISSLRLKLTSSTHFALRRGLEKVLQINYV